MLLHIYEYLNLLISKGFLFWTLDDICSEEHTCIFTLDSWVAWLLCTSNWTTAVNWPITSESIRAWTTLVSISRISAHDSRITRTIRTSYDFLNTVILRTITGHTGGTGTTTKPFRCVVTWNTYKEIASFSWWIKFLIFNNFTIDNAIE